ncbi:MAG: FAD-binding oxidoreductase [Armatimonadetes bacterium]|nr:FAD-binding oxidoreductase [Armatimonadota bacterium]
MSKPVYDVIVIGAGSVGVPIAMSLAGKKLKVLIIDSFPSPGQGNNKKAIGGVRATHSDYGKIKISQRSIEIFSSWKEKFGDDLGWIFNGYSFPAYNKEDENKLKNLMKIQHEFGLNISWISPKEYSKLVPGICTEGLQGSTYSPDDGSCSPLLALHAFYFKSIEYGTKYNFNETVIDIKLNSNKITEVITDKGKYSCEYLVNAAGNSGKEIGEMVGLDLPIKPDCHEGAITEPVKRFFGPMVVDMRPAEGSANYYFYQNNEGQVVFCITPAPPILGTCDDSTSVFFPQVAKRMVSLYPRLANLKVRRSWRGQYPMTPDGFPIVGKIREIKNYVHTIGMCGQGFMLGPGLGELIARIIIDEKASDDDKILKSFDPYRDFSGMEAFK